MITVLLPSRHGRDRHHHLVPREGVFLPNTRFARAGRTLCGLPAGEGPVPDAVCDECDAVAATLARFEAESAQASWRAWKDQVALGKSKFLALAGWPAERDAVCELVASRDMGPFLAPAASSVVFASKRRSRTLMTLHAWRVFDVRAITVGDSHALRVVALDPWDARIPPRDPRLEPWPGDLLVRGARTRLIVGRTAGDGTPGKVLYRDHRGIESSILPSTWGRWAAAASIVRSARPPFCSPPSTSEGALHAR